MGWMLDADRHTQHRAVLLGKVIYPIQSTEGLQKQPRGRAGGHWEEVASTRREMLRNLGNTQ